MSYGISIIYNQTVNSAFKSSLAKPTSIIIPWAEKQVDGVLPLKTRRPAAIT